MSGLDRNETELSKSVTNELDTFIGNEGKGSARDALNVAMARMNALTAQLAAVTAERDAANKIIEDGNQAYVNQINALIDERDAARADHLQTAEVLSHLQMASVKKDLEIMRLRDALRDIVKSGGMFGEMTASAKIALAALEAYRAREDPFNYQPNKYKSDGVTIAELQEELRIERIENGIRMERSINAERTIRNLREALERFAKIDLTQPVDTGIVYDILHARAALEGKP